jgi:hypothetical protein
MRLTWSERFNVYAGEEDALRACINGLADAMDHPRGAMWLLLLEQKKKVWPLPRPLRVVLCVDTQPALFGPTAMGSAMFLRAADPERRQSSPAELYAGDLEVEVSNPDEWRLVDSGVPMARRRGAGPCTVRVALRRLVRLRQPPPLPHHPATTTTTTSTTTTPKASLTERAASVLRLL